MPDLLDDPVFDALKEQERADYQAALADPTRRPALQLKATMTLLAEQRAARLHCQQTCAPGFNRRLAVLERFRWLFLGGAGVVLAVLGVLEALGLLRR